MLHSRNIAQRNRQTDRNRCDPNGFHFAVHTRPLASYGTKQFIGNLRTKKDVSAGQTCRSFQICFTTATRPFQIRVQCCLNECQQRSQSASHRCYDKRIMHACPSSHRQYHEKGISDDNGSIFGNVAREHKLTSKTGKIKSTWPVRVR